VGRTAFFVVIGTSCVGLSHTNVPIPKGYPATKDKRLRKPFPPMGVVAMELA
jgi:hypothetical protein